MIYLIINTIMLVYYLWGCLNPLGLCQDNFSNPSPPSPESWVLKDPAPTGGVIRSTSLVQPFPKAQA